MQTFDNCQYNYKYYQQSVVKWDFDASLPSYGGKLELVGIGCPENEA